MLIVVWIFLLAGCAPSRQNVETLASTTIPGTISAPPTVQPSEASLQASTPDGSFILGSQFWKAIEYPPIESWVTKIAIAPDGTLWLATERDGVVHYNGANWTIYNKENGLPDNFIKDVLVTSAGIVWIGTQNSGVVRFDGQSWVHYTTEDGLTDNEITRLATTADGAIWVGTKYGGVSRFDGISWVSYTSQVGLASDYVTAILETPDGVMWIGTDRGLSRFDGMEWVTLRPKDMGFTKLGEYMRTSDLCLSPDGTLWVAVYQQGVAKYARGYWQAYWIDSSQTNAVLNIAVDRDNNLWAGTFEQGFYRYDGDRWASYKLGEVPFQVVWDIAVAPNGDLWLVTDSEIYHQLP